MTQIDYSSIPSPTDHYERAMWHLGAAQAARMMPTEEMDQTMADLAIAQYHATAAQAHAALLQAQIASDAVKLVPQRGGGMLTVTQNAR